MRDPAPADLAEAMRARARVRTAEDEARRVRVLDGARETLRALLREGRARRAWVIGSAAWGGFGARSDVDVVVEGADPRGRAALAERVDAAAGARADLLLLEELAPSFRARVLAEGLEIDGP